MGKEKVYFKRAPREWKWAPSYVGHVVQLLVVGLVMPLPLLGSFIALFYIKYQETEYRRAQDLQEAIKADREPLQEWLSRDIADGLVGLWIAFMFRGFLWVNPWWNVGIWYPFG